MSEDFFAGKRPWSLIKDQILQDYLPPYLSKVKKLRNNILLIDAFAGPGIFCDGSKGSPYIITENAEKHAPGRYTALFMNKELEHHRSLLSNMSTQPWFNNVVAVHGDSTRLLDSIVEIITNQTVFLYLDPFGLDCSFDLLKPFINRDHGVSTEILINFNMQAIHRLNGNPKCHEKLDQVFGGSYWRHILNSGEETKLREKQLVDSYTQMLAAPGYLQYTGACPVQETPTSQTKYYMIFASRHPDALELMNNIMCKAYHAYMHNTTCPLFSEQDWTIWSDEELIEQIALKYISTYAGETRSEIWIRIIQDQFMRYTASQYKKAIKSLVKKNLVHFVSTTGKQNDTSKLYPV